jgi:hypothetical protein
MIPLLTRPELTTRRVGAAFAVAMVCDALQVLLAPLGWTFVDDVLDLVAMFLLCSLIGFHPLLLPTFVLEIVPIAEMLPGWTACVGVVVALRRKQKTDASAPPEPPPPGVIDV